MDTAHDLGCCTGFVALSPGERSGVVEQVLLSPDGEPDALAIRFGVSDVEHVIADVHSIAGYVPERGQVYLREGWRERFVRAPIGTGAGGEPISCTLAYALGRIEECPRAECPFWRVGDGDAGCPIAALEPALRRHPEAASLLLDVRREVGALTA